MWQYSTGIMTYATGYDSAYVFSKNLYVYIAHGNKKIIWVSILISSVGYDNCYIIPKDNLTKAQYLPMYIDTLSLDKWLPAKCCHTILVNNLSINYSNSLTKMGRFSSRLMITAKLANVWSVLYHCIDALQKASISTLKLKVKYTGNCYVKQLSLI